MRSEGTAAAALSYQRLPHPHLWEEVRPLDPHMKGRCIYLNNVESISVFLQFGYLEWF